MHSSGQEATAKANGDHTGTRAVAAGRTAQPTGQTSGPTATVRANAARPEEDVDRITREDIEDLNNILQTKVDMVVKENMLAARNDLDKQIHKMLSAPEKDTSEPPASIKQYIIKQIEKQMALTIKTQISSMV